MQFFVQHSELRDLYDKVAAGQRISEADGLRLFESKDLNAVGAIADLEHAIGRHEALNRALSRWTVLHIAAALVMYPLLALHIWNGIYFGLRWLR